MFSFKSVGVAATACAAGTVCTIASGLAYYKRKTAVLATERAAAGKVGLAGLLIEAGIFIAEKHTDQHAPTRTHESIVNHYLRVADILNTHSVHDPAVLQASILLGTMTDARTTFRELCAKFGPKVAVIVQALTVDGHVPVYGRPQRLLACAACSPACRGLRCS